MHKNKTWPNKRAIDKANGCRHLPTCAGYPYKVMGIQCKENNGVETDKADGHVFNRHTFFLTLFSYQTNKYNGNVINKLLSNNHTDDVRE